MREESTIPWLPLLRQLTEASHDWGIWKNADSALAGHGDIDSVAPRADHDRLISHFHRWAIENEFTPVFTCNHIPGVVVIVGLRHRHELVELDLCERQAFRGSNLFEATDLRPMMHMDERGFRRVRSGVEGLLLLFLSGMRNGGRPDHEALRLKRISQLLREDPEGVELAASLFGNAMRSATRVANAVVEGGWDRSSALKVEAWSGLRALRDPTLLASRFLFRAVRDSRCPLWGTIVHQRRIEGDVETWLSTIQRTHDQLPRC